MRSIATALFGTLLLASALVIRAAPSAPAIITDPNLPERTVEKVSPHVFAIKGFPNIGIIVGDKATLVVDTGLGARNGKLVAGEARRLSTHGQRLYLTT